MKSFLESDFTDNQFTKESVFSIFMPNTYEFYWNSTSDDFRNRMLKYFKSYWTVDRKRKPNH